MPQHCAAYGCTSRRGVQTRKERITFHKFPPDPALRTAWESAVRRAGFCSSASSVLCSQHFKEADIDRTGQIVRIREGAVPSVFSVPAQLPNTANVRRQPGESQDTHPLDLTTKNRSEPIRSTEEKVLDSLPTDEHSYAVSSSPDTLKDKLYGALARIEDLERQLRNANDRQRRCKITLKRTMKDLKKKNLIVKELRQKLGLYSDACLDVISNNGHSYEKQNKSGIT